MAEGLATKVRLFLVHIATVTLGVLIALSLEGGREWGRNRQLAREAQSNLASEIRDNKKELDQVLADMANTRRQLQDSLKLVAELEKPGTQRFERNLSLEYNAASLTAASYKTAEATGALGHMTYAQVRRYASVYDLQSEFIDMQRRFVDQFVVMTSAPELLANPNAAQLDRMRQGLLRTLAYLSAQGQFGRALTKSYAEALAAK